MIWSFFAVSGSGQIAIIQKLIPQVYQDILQDYVKVAACQLKLSKSWVMQQDNDPKHQSIYCRIINKSTNKQTPFGAAQSEPRPYPIRGTME